MVFQDYKDIDRHLPGARLGIARLRLWHFAIITPVAAGLFRFCQDVLGFRYTDDIGQLAHVGTCNRDHHVIFYIVGQ